MTACFALSKYDWLEWNYSGFCSLFVSIVGVDEIKLLQTASLSVRLAGMKLRRTTFILR